MRAVTPPAAVAWVLIVTLACIALTVWAVMAALL
jgi:hypothetical protein